MTKIFAMSRNMEPGHTKKQSNIRIRRNYKRNDLVISFDKSGDVMCVKHLSLLFLVQKKKLVINVGENFLSSLVNIEKSSE